MKKRAKIITTIASLCLAVALMTFGVFAATSVTLGVTSKVKFEVTDVFVTISAKIEIWDADHETAAQYVAATPEGEGAVASLAATPTYTGTVAATGTAAPTDYTGAVNFGKVAFTSSDDAIKITIKVTNDSLDDSVYFKVDKLLDDNGGTTEYSQYYIDSSEKAATSKTISGTGVNNLTANTFVELQHGETVYIVYTRVLDLKSKSFDNVNSFATNGVVTLTVAHTNS